MYLGMCKIRLPHRPEKFYIVLTMGTSEVHTDKQALVLVGHLKYFVIAPFSLKSGCLGLSLQKTVKERWRSTVLSPTMVILALSLETSRQQR